LTLSPSCLNSIHLIQNQNKKAPDLGDTYTVISEKQPSKDNSPPGQVAPKTRAKRPWLGFWRMFQGGLGGKDKDGQKIPSFKAYSLQ